jgi:uncharacterized GH25 family protein
MRKISLLLLPIALVIAAIIVMSDGEATIEPLEGQSASQPEIGSEAASEGLPAFENDPLTREVASSETLGSQNRPVQARVAKGEVAVPPACVSEGDFSVYAWSEEVSLDHIQSFSSTEPGDTLESGAVLLGLSAVDTNGNFQIELETDLEEVHLFALGQFAYSSSSTPLLLNENESEVFLTTLCGGRVRGQLDGIEGEDPTEIWVELTTSRLTVDNNTATQRQLTRETQLNQEGEFDFIAVPTGREFEVQVQPELMAPTLLEVTALIEGEERFLKQTLRAGGKMTGRVLDPSGAPVEGAKVKTIGGRAAIAIMGWAEQSTETNEDGEFSITGLPAGRVMIGAGKEGYLDSSIEAIELLPAETKTNIELKLSEGNSIAGSVRWPSGEPVFGAEVKVNFDRAALLGAESINAARGAEGQTTTDAKGAFRVKALGNGPFTVTATATPEGDRMEVWLAEETQLAVMNSEAQLEEDEDLQWTASMNSVRPNLATLELALQAPEVISGVVKDEQDRAVESYELVFVRLQDSALGSIGVETRSRSIEDEAGRFLIPGVSAGSWHAYALADGYSRPEPALINIPRDPGAEALVFTLERACKVSGVIFTPSGAPAQGASVRVKTALSPMISSFSSDLSEPTALSGSAGEFSLSGLRSGEIELVASTTGYAASAPLPINLTSGEERSNLRLELRLGCSITGVLYDSEGELASGATVQILRPSDYSTQLTSTDDEGFFQVENLEPGSWQVIGLPSLLSAIGGGEGNAGGRSYMMQGMQIQLIELADGETQHVILGEPPADPVRMWGRVTHQDEALKGATLIMIAEGKSGFPKLASTDTEGRYEMTLDAPGEYLLTVQRSENESYVEQHSSSFKVQVPLTAELQHDVKLPEGVVRGRVTLSSGEAAAYAPISLAPDNSAGFSNFSELTNTIVTCAEDGSFSIDGVRPGSYRLRGGGVGYIQRMLSASKEISAPYGQSTLSIAVKENQIIEGLSLVLPEAGEIKVRVVGASGAPVEDATIFIRHEDGTPAEEFAVASTDTKGDCIYEGLSEGVYQVSARSSEEASAEGTQVKVRPGETSELELRLEKGTLLTVLTVDGEDTPIACKLRVVDSEGREHASYFSVIAMQKRMSAEGLSTSEQVIGPLPPGRYRVHATSADGKSEDKPVNLRGQAERAVKIRFR